MPRLFVALLVALGVATIWRRHELRQDTDRASRAILNAASAARSRLASSESVDDGAAPSAEASESESTEFEPTEVAEVAESTESSEVASGA